MELETTLKAIKAFPAVDVSGLSYDDMMELLRGKTKRCIAYSGGAYGVNGQVFTLDGEFYKVIGRCYNLFLVM